MKITRFFPLALCLLITISHISGVAIALAQDAGSSQENGESKDYRLQGGDSISMSIYDEPDMSVGVTIGKSNSISFPLIGQVNIRGYTVPELEQELRKLYMKDYYVDPKVRVIITGYHSKYFHVSGAVEQPGRHLYPEEGSINLAQAVAMCGGIDQDGDLEKVTVFKRARAGSSTYDMSSQGNVTLDPWDTVVVPRLPSRNITYMATVSGEVNRPGNINLDASGRLDVISAVAQAGGYSRIANEKVGIVQRKIGEGKFRMEEIKLKDIRDGKLPMEFINEGDILIIKESRW